MKTYHIEVDGLEHPEFQAETPEEAMRQMIGHSGRIVLMEHEPKKYTEIAVLEIHTQGISFTENG